MSTQMATSCDTTLAMTPLQDMSIGSQGSRPAQLMTKELEGIISTDSRRKRYGHTALDPSSSMNGTCKRRCKARSGHHSCPKPVESPERRWGLRSSVRSASRMTNSIVVGRPPPSTSVSYFLGIESCLGRKQLRVAVRKISGKVLDSVLLFEASARYRCSCRLGRDKCAKR